MSEPWLDQIRTIASKYPEAERTFILGDHEVFRVRKKVFVWLGSTDEGGTYVSVKTFQRASCPPSCSRSG